MPIEHRMVARSLRYLQVLVNRKKDPIPKWVVAFIFLFVSVEMRSPPPLHGKSTGDRRLNTFSLVIT